MTGEAKVDQLDFHWLVYVVHHHDVIWLDVCMYNSYVLQEL